MQRGTAKISQEAGLFIVRWIEHGLVENESRAFETAYQALQWCKDQDLKIVRGRPEVYE